MKNTFITFGKIVGICVLVLIAFFGIDYAINKHSNAQKMEPAVAQILQQDSNIKCGSAKEVSQWPSSGYRIVVYCKFADNSFKTDSRLSKDQYDEKAALVNKKFDDISSKLIEDGWNKLGEYQMGEPTHRILRLTKSIGNVSFFIEHSTLYVSEEFKIYSVK